MEAHSWRGFPRRVATSSRSSRTPGAPRPFPAAPGERHGPARGSWPRLGDPFPAGERHGLGRGSRPQGLATSQMDGDRPPTGTEPCDPHHVPARRTEDDPGGQRPFLIRRRDTEVTAGAGQLQTQGVRSPGGDCMKAHLPARSSECPRLEAERHRCPRLACAVLRPGRVPDDRDHHEQPADDLEWTHPRAPEVPIVGGATIACPGRRARAPLTPRDRPCRQDRDRVSGAEGGSPTFQGAGPRTAPGGPAGADVRRRDVGRRRPWPAGQRLADSFGAT